MRFNAWNFARAWASVALAQSNEKGRPALHRTTMIELFEKGVRLVSTDSFLLLKAWVPNREWDGSPEPGADVLPDEVAICRDVDQRVLALMRYAQTLTAKDGDDTVVTLQFGFGTMNAEQGQLAGMVDETVWFRLSESYDERIEAPQFEGTFPEWRPLWFGHRWEQTGVVQFGADSISRLGKLSALWDKAGLEFHLGGATGVAKVVIKAPDVSVSGLLMPLRNETEDAAASPSQVVPPSEEGIHIEYGDALDKFLADVLAGEVATSDDDTDDAILNRATRVVTDAGYGTGQLLVDELGVSMEKAMSLIDALVNEGVLAPEDGRPDALLDQAATYVIAEQAASARKLCNHLGIGNARAARLIELLEEYGIVGAAEGSKPRQVLVPPGTEDALPQWILLPDTKFKVIGSRTVEDGGDLEEPL